MGNPHPDELDRQLVHALTIAPRAPFRVLGDALGVSDQTAARRYRKLAETAGLRVQGLVHGSRAGWVDWLVRLHATPGGAERIADSLARRPDTRWVRLFSGGTEIVCVLQARTPQQRDALFLHGLPGSRQVVQVSAHSILHNFSAVAWEGLTSSLPAGRLARLRAAAGTAVPGAEATLQPHDDPLLAELACDGRTSNAAIAKAIHWNESTVRRRIEELTQAGLLYFDVDVTDTFVGNTASAMLWLLVEPAHLAGAGRMLAAQPEIPFAAATTGPTNLVASGVFRDTHHLYEYLTTSLTAVPGLRSVESAPIIGTLKRTSTVRLGGLPPT
ncbi:MAG: Lrp/AsnC family transcriptional regulator [Mycobacteriales bacterium]